MALLAEDAFRMKLHALEIPFAVTDPIISPLALRAVTLNSDGSVGGSITSE